MPWCELCVASYNVGDGATARKLPDLNMLVDLGIHVIFGQEFGDRLDLVRAFLKRNPTWGVVWNDDRNRSRDSVILYDTAALTLIRWKQHYVKIGYLGPKGAGGDAPGVKVLTEAVFRHVASGRKVRLQNHHAIASAFSTRGAEGKRRKAAWGRQMATFFRLVARSPIVVIGGGDWNAADTNPALRARTPRRWRWVPTGPTRGKRRIDLIGYMRDPRVRLVSGDVVESEGSKRYGDHRIALAVFRLRMTRHKHKH